MASLLSGLVSDRALLSLLEASDRDIINAVGETENIAENSRSPMVEGEGRSLFPREERRILPKW